MKSIGKNTSFPEKFEKFEKLTVTLLLVGPRVQIISTGSGDVINPEALKTLIGAGSEVNKMHEMWAGGGEPFSKKKVGNRLKVSTGDTSKKTIKISLFVFCCCFFLGGGLGFGAFNSPLGRVP